MRVIAAIHQTLLDVDYKLSNIGRKNRFVNDGRDNIETTFYCFVLTVFFTWSKQGAAKSRSVVTTGRETPPKIIYLANEPLSSL